MNITVGNYETKNFDIYSLAVEAFSEFHTADKNEMAKMETAAKYVDAALGILKRAMEHQSMNTHDLEDIIDYIDKAEEVLDEVNELENHYYLRDNLEALAIELYDLEDHHADDDAESEHETEEWLFGDEVSEEMHYFSEP